jgi:FMNH2-dependent dimethyl sulfone monooxygenase
MEEQGNRFLELGVFMPNCSHAYTVSTYPTSTEWTWNYNKAVALLAEELGFDFLLPVARWMPWGGETQFNGTQLEVTAWASALAAVTKRITIFSTVHTGTINPAVMAKIGATIDHMSGGRWGINIVSAAFRNEYEMMGLPWPPHDRRYDMSTEFIRVLKGLWTQDQFDFSEEFFQIRGGYLSPKPVRKPHPPIVQAGVSEAAKKMTAELVDYYFICHTDLRVLAELVKEMRERAAAYGRTIKCCTHAYCLWRDTESEAQDVHSGILERVDTEAVWNWATLIQGERPKDTAFTTTELPVKDIAFGLIAYPLVGTAESVAEGIRQLRSIGIDAVLCVFLNYLEDLDRFGREVLPLLEKMGLRNPVRQ